MSAFDSRPDDDGLDRWCADQFHDLVTDLAATLDVQAGLHEALIPTRHAELVADLDLSLDVKAGLAAIVPVIPDLVPSDESFPPSAPPPREVLSRPPSRLAVRDWLSTRIRRDRFRYSGVHTVLAVLSVLAILAGIASFVVEHEHFQEQVRTIEHEPKPTKDVWRELIADRNLADQCILRIQDPADSPQPHRVGNVVTGEPHLVAGAGCSQVDYSLDFFDPTSPTPTTRLYTVAFAPDGRTLATGRGDRSVILWDVSDPDQPHRLGQPLTYSWRVLSVAFASDRNTLATALGDGSVVLSDVSDPDQPRPLGQPLTYSGRVHSVAFTSRNTLATALGDGSVVLSDVSNPDQPRQLGHF